MKNSMALHILIDLGIWLLISLTIMKGPLSENAINYLNFYCLISFLVAVLILYSDKAREGFIEECSKQPKWYNDYCKWSTFAEAMAIATAGLFWPGLLYFAAGIIMASMRFDAGERNK